MRRRWTSRLVLAIVSLAIAVGASWTFAEWRFEAGLSRARADLAARRFEAARRWLASQATGRPEHAEAAYLLGVCEEALGHAEAAATALARVPPDSRFGGDAAMARARTLIDDLGRYTEAEDVLLRGHGGPGRGPSAAPFRYALSQLLFWEGRLDEMRRLVAGGLEELARPGRRPARPLADRPRAADVRLDPGGRRGRRRAMPRTTTASGWPAPTWRCHAGRLDEAARWLDACLRRRPDDPVVWRARLRWARAADRVDEARRAWRTCPPTGSRSPRCCRSAPGSPPAEAAPTPSGPRSSS